MKLTESMTICYVSVEVSRTIKVNIKETFMGNDPFPQIFIWEMHCSQRIRCITCSEGRMYSCYYGKSLNLS